jgi:hypothetical protein
MLNNFCYVVTQAGGEYFKWLGDDDWIHPAFASRSVAALAAEPSLVLVTTQQSFLEDDGSIQTRPYVGVALRSDRSGNVLVRFPRGELDRIDPGKQFLDGAAQRES